jgi:hypothetical protein
MRTGRGEKLSTERNVDAHTFNFVCLRACIIFYPLLSSTCCSSCICDNLYGRCSLMSFLPAVFTDKCWLGDANDSWRQEVVAKDEEAKTTLHARLGLGEYHCFSSNTILSLIVHFFRQRNSLLPHKKSQSLQQCCIFSVHVISSFFDFDSDKNERDSRFT